MHSRRARNKRREIPSHLFLSLISVFDPLKGVGSSGVAALNINRRFLGFDSQRIYVKVAGRRFREVYGMTVVPIKRRVVQPFLLTPSMLRLEEEKEALPWRHSSQHHRREVSVTEDRKPSIILVFFVSKSKLNVVIDHKIKFLFGEVKMFREDCVNFVNNTLRLLKEKILFFHCETTAAR